MSSRFRMLPVHGVGVLLALLAHCGAMGQTPVPRWEQMDYGPFLQSSVTLPWSRDGEALDGIVLKGLTVRLGSGAACFDGELRWACAWTGGWLKLMGTPFDGTHRPPEKSRPAVVGQPIFGTSHGPGWAEGEVWRDPRTEPYVPLPRDWAHYSGLHVRGDSVVIEYTVGTTRILERPELVGVGAGDGFVRRIEVGPHSEPLSLLVAETRLELRRQHAFNGAASEAGPRVMRFGDLTAGVKGGSENPSWGVRTGDRLTLTIPPSKGVVRMSLLVTMAKPSEVGVWVQEEERAAALSTVLKTSGPARYPTVLTNRGELGEGSGAYAVDAIPLPVDNPWHSWMRPGGFDFFSDGKTAALCTWSGDVWTVSGLDEGLERLVWRRHATGLFQPLGLKIVKDRVHVLGRDQITRLIDLNGDGEADAYENFNNRVSITPNFHEFSLDLHTDPEGNFYFTKGAPLLGTDYWDPISLHNGSLLKVSSDGRQLERFATGLRAPNGSGVGPHGEITCSDNEGIWTPVCRLNWVRRGGFYGAVGMDHRSAIPTEMDPPLCWLPFAVDNSAGDQAWMPKTFGPLADQLLHFSYGKCRAFLVLRQEVGRPGRGVMQGGVVPLPWRFDSSAMRSRVNPRDGTLYVGGFKGWQTTAARDGALHRVRPTGKALSLPVGFRATREGIELDFNTDLDAASVADLQNWNVQWWNYRWSHRYGSDLYAVSDPNRVVAKKGEMKGEPVPIRSVALGSNRRTVRMSVDGMRPVMQLMIRGGLKTDTGASLPVEFYGTINALAPR